MAVTATNLIQGPASIYFAPFGSAEPATPLTAPATPWVDLGGTRDGVSMEDASEYSVLDVDQLVYEVARVRTKRAVTVKTSLAEATLANYARAVNDAAPTTATGTSTFTPAKDTAAFLPPYGAIIVDGIAPGGFRRRVTLRKVLSTDNVELAYKKDGQTVIPVTFTLHYVSASIDPYLIVDQTA